VRLAARAQGTFRVEQVAAIWGFVREHWRYVNDPNGREYFAPARETIANNYAGDCDDFAITLAAMVAAVGGATRVVVMEGPRGGHAYTEVCIREEPTVVAGKLARFYGRAWARYAPSGRGHVAFRRAEDCPVWLNLDWNAAVPGGDYEPEAWAVAVYPDGRTETLAVAGGAPPDASTRAGSVPRRLATPPVPTE
jgi:transglutaminase-like putative cysteine protease